MPSRTDLALRVNDALPGDEGLWMMIPQGCHGIANLARGRLRTDNGCDLTISRNVPAWNLPYYLIDAVKERVWHR